MAKTYDKGGTVAWAINMHLQQCVLEWPASSPTKDKLCLKRLAKIKMSLSKCFHVVGEEV